MAEATQDPRTYFAEERTFLAWIRTGLGLMGVGFAVARFGLFLRQMVAGGGHPGMRGTGYSVYAGVALVALGVAVNLLAVEHHVRTVRQLRSGTWMPGKVSLQAIGLAVLLALVGLGMAGYLLFLR